MADFKLKQLLASAAFGLVAGNAHAADPAQSPIIKSVSDACNEAVLNLPFNRAVCAKSALAAATSYRAAVENKAPDLLRNLDPRDAKTVRDNLGHLKDFGNRPLPGAGAEDTYAQSAMFRAYSLADKANNVARMLPDKSLIQYGEPLQVVLNQARINLNQANLIHKP